MDLNMPDMDGLAATRTLRQDPRFNNLPVLAMTADDREETWRRCAAAGMDGRISKTIDAAEIHGAILRCSVEARPPVSEKNLAPVLQGIDLESALGRLGGNERTLELVFNAFVKEHQDSGTSLRDTLKGGDREAARQLAHALKGTSGNISAERLHRAALKLERATKPGISRASKATGGLLVSSLGPGVVLLVHLHDVGSADMSVDLGRRDVRVAQHGLDGS